MRGCCSAQRAQHQCQRRDDHPAPSRPMTRRGDQALVQRQWISPTRCNARATHRTGALPRARLPPPQRLTPRAVVEFLDKSVSAVPCRFGELACLRSSTTSAWTGTGRGRRTRVFLAAVGFSGNLAWVRFPPSPSQPVDTGLSTNLQEKRLRPRGNGWPGPRRIPAGVPPCGDLRCKLVCATLRSMARDERRRSQLLRGVLDLCLLAIIDQEPAYGYEMTKRLRARGLATVGQGSIYPLLGRLERDGLVETYRAASDGGPPRKYYRTSGVGHETLKRGSPNGEPHVMLSMRY